MSQELKGKILGLVHPLVHQQEHVTAWAIDPGIFSHLDELHHLTNKILPDPSSRNRLFAFHHCSKQQLFLCTLAYQ